MQLGAVSCFQIYLFCVHTWLPVTDLQDSCHIVNKYAFESFKVQEQPDARDVYVCITDV
jgi:hypothetical protein